MRKTGWALILLFMFVFTFQLAPQVTMALEAPEQQSIFNDVNTGHWGFRDITKISVRNIVRGYVDGTFKPDKSVTQIEALLMVVRNMDSGGLLSDIDVSQPLPVKVPNWAEEGCKPEILFSIENGLIVPAENNFNASAPATRAWITKLLVRMINRENEALGLNDQSLKASDAADIPVWARSYTAWALKNRLIKGYPDGTFKPNQAVTRAEMASLLSRSEPFLELGEKVIHGKFMGINDQTVFLTVKGQLKTFKINETARIFSENGKKANLTDFQANSAITLIFDESDVSFVEALPSTYTLEKVRGTVLKILKEEGVIVFRDNKDKIFAGVLSNQAFISSQAGDIDSLAQITTGGQVEVGYNSDNQIVHVKLLNGKYDNNEFIIQEIQNADNLLVVKSPSGQSRSFKLSGNVNIKIPGVRFPVINDLQPGDKVFLSFSGNTVNEIELLKANQETSITGKIVFVSIENKLLAIQKDNGTIETFPTDSGVKVIINGYSKAQLSDISTNDIVSLDVQNGFVVSVTVKDKSTETVIKGTIVSIDDYNEVITISTENTYDLKSYKLSRNAKIIVDGRNRSISSLETGMKVELKLENNQIVQLDHNNIVEGIIKSIKKNRITLTTGSTSTTLELDDNLKIYIHGRSKSDLDDLNIADYVELKTEDNKVTEINVRQIFNYQVVKISEGTREITVWDLDGSAKTIGIDSKTIIDIAGVSNPFISDLAVGSNITVTFTGKRTSKISMEQVTRGKVITANLSTNTLIIQTFDGKTETFRFNDRCQVTKGTSKSYSLSALSEGDRIEAAQTGSNAYNFTVMTKESGNYQTLTNNDTKITIVKSNSFSLNRFLASDVYIHKGTRNQKLSDLSPNIPVELYSLNNIVFEIDLK